MMAAGVQFTNCQLLTVLVSMNFIDPEAYTLNYCSFDDAFALVTALGNGGLMAKTDLQNAFRLISVRPEYWNLLDIHWKNQFYIDTCLLLGLKSAPFLFNQLADALRLYAEATAPLHDDQLVFKGGNTGQAAFDNIYPALTAKYTIQPSAILQS